MLPLESVVRNASSVLVWSNAKPTQYVDPNANQVAQIIWGGEQDFRINQTPDNITNLGANYGLTGTQSAYSMDAYFYDTICSNSYVADLFSHCQDPNKPKDQTNSQIIYSESRRKTHLKKIYNPDDAEQWIEVAVIDVIEFTRSDGKNVAFTFNNL